MAATYDYIIVGAGSAGCVLANRLSEDGARVLVLEAGGWDRDPWIHIPLGIGKIFPRRQHDWMYSTAPDPGLDGRSIECARGKVIGGSSSVNVMAYVRGHRGDYDRWAANGLPQWSYTNVLPYFRRSESWRGGADAFRGGDGPLSTRPSVYEDPLIADIIAAGKSAGYPVTPDYNGAQQDGFGVIQSTIRDGRRCSAAVAYLHPALTRANLTVETGALVTRIVLERSRAVGIEYVRNGERHTVRAEREVILAGGVINSPQLLMLSGIGDPDALRPHGIASTVELPGVGRNLQDHISFFVAYVRKDPSPFLKAMRFDRLALSIARAKLFGTGFASDVPVGVTAFLKTTSSAELPDIQFLFLAAGFPSHPWLRPFVEPAPDTFGCRIALLRPQSRGAVTLASADPAAAPAIRQNFFATEADKRTLRAGLDMMRQVATRPELSLHIASEIAPGARVTSDTDIDAYVRKTAVTVHHPAGTCRMGAVSDPMAVVDPELRVRGVEGLCVVDASVMPDLVGGNINAPVMMIAEKAADMIRGRPPLA